MRIQQVLAGDRGMTLVEVLVALVILSVGILSAMTLFTNSFKVSMDNRYQATAYNLAQEIIEEYKAKPSLIKDKTVDFQPPVSPITLDNKTYTPSISVTYDTVNSTRFGQVKVTVSWTSAIGVTKSVQRTTRIALD